MGRRWPRRALAAVGLLALAWGSYRAAAGWWYRAELSRAKREVAAGRFGPARERLARLSASWPGEAEVHYQLGRLRAGRGASRPGAGGLGPDRARVALRREGGPRAATRCSGSSSTAASSRPWRSSSRWPDAATGRVPPRRGRPSSGSSASRGDSTRSKHCSGTNGTGPRTLLGRSATTWMLDAEPVPIEMVRGVLDEAAGQAPDDDRVWLGRANLATWSGRFEEADRWLSACLGRRPERPGRLARPARLGARHRASRRRRGGPRAICRPTGSTRPRSSSCTPGSPASGATARPSASPWNA